MTSGPVPCKPKRGSTVQSGTSVRGFEYLDWYAFGGQNVSGGERFVHPQARQEYVSAGKVLRPLIDSLRPIRQRLPSSAVRGEFPAIGSLPRTVWRYIVVLVAQGG